VWANVVPPGGTAAGRGLIVSRAVTEIDTTFDRVAKHSGVSPDQLAAAKHFVRTVAVPALESLRPGLEAAGRSVTVTPALEARRDRDVVYSSIAVSHGGDWRSSTGSACA
jgi:hypothetical protein